MSRADHPAGRALHGPNGQLACSSIGCTGRPAARVAPADGFAVVRALTNPHTAGHLVCLDCAHHAVDVMLLRATPEPSR